MGEQSCPAWTPDGSKTFPRGGPAASVASAPDTPAVRCFFGLKTFCTTAEADQTADENTESIVL